MKQLLKVLQSIEKSGSFCASASITPCFLGLEVKNIGAIGLPLQPKQAIELIAQCQQAPFGRGEKTVIDTDVRRVWELNPNQFTITNPQWQKILTSICDNLQTELGVVDDIVADIYKLLVYEKDSFFLPHCDTEKLDRMFATLVVVLPSAHEGGELIVCHDGEEKRFAFGGKNSEFEMRYVAFYADCQHEVKPVTSGYRLCLIYNLALANRNKPAPLAAKNSAVVNNLISVLRDWVTAEENKFTHFEPTADKAKPAQSLRAVLLKHKYTQAELGFENLKNLDRVYAQVLTQAAGAANCQIHLALVTLWECGDIDEDYGGYYGSRGRSHYDDDDDYEMGEVFDSSLSIDDWIDSAGNKKQFGEISISDEQLVTNEDMDSGKPDEEEIEGPTGNAGATMDRWYHRAALVIWPTQQHFSILAAVGQYRAVPELQQMLADKPSDLTACLAFAAGIIDNWSISTHGYFSVADADENPPVLRMLVSLIELADIALLSRFFSEILRHDFSGTEGQQIAAVCERYGWATFAEILLQMSEQTQLERVAAFSQILAALCESKTRDEQLCIKLAEHTVHNLMNYEEKLYGENSAEFKQAAIACLFKAIYLLKQASLLEQLGQELLNARKRFDLRDVLHPVLLAIGQWLKAQKIESAIFNRVFLQPCLAEFKQAATFSIEKPQDWVRSSGELSCNCEDCGVLQQFLQNPLEEEHRFKMRQDRRTHVEKQIERYKLDISCATERFRSPHTLVCTKNYASYERAKLQQAADTTMWHELEKL